jgi:putative spermidine/putrescine transport system permease protein
MVLGARWPERLGRAGVLGVAALALLVIVLPLVLVVWLSFVADAILVLPPSGYSMHWYRSLAGQPQFASGFLTSLSVAVTATLAGLLVSVPAALVLARGRFPGRDAIVHLLTAPLIVPAIVIGAALYVALVSGMPVLAFRRARCEAGM